MPRYYFDVFDGVGMLADTVGDEFESDAAAADQAVSLLPELAKDHIPRKHDLTVATSLRNGDGDVIYRSIGLIRSEWDDPNHPNFVVSVQEIRHSLAQSEKLRQETKRLREKIRANIFDLFSQLERLAATQEIRCNTVREG